MNSSGRLPDFIIIGAAKCGTSSLFHYLCRHPTIYGSNPKEPCFFDEAVAWKNGLPWYTALFSTARPDQVCGEASTNYTRLPQVPGVPKRIKSLAPDVKLIYIMRHPVDRAYSHYIHRWEKELHYSRPFSERFEDFIKADRVCLDSSNYKMQVSAYLEHFEPDQMHFVLLDELEKQPRVAVAETLNFLEIEATDRELTTMLVGRQNVSSRFREDMVRRRIMEPLRKVPLVRWVRDRVSQESRDSLYEFLRRSWYGGRIHSAYQPPQMLPETRRELLSEFEETTRWAEELFGRSLDQWRS